MNPTDLARKLGVTPGYLMNIESGRKKPPVMDRIEQICNELRIPTGECDEMKKIAALERMHAPERTIMQQKEPIIEIFTHSIPVVSSVGATGDKGQANFHPYEPPYKVISFKGCKALVVESNSMAPIAYKGQKIIYCEKEPVHDGDLVFVKFKDGDQVFKRYYKNGDDVITFHSVNPVESPKPILKKSKDIEFCYKVVGIKF